MKSEKTNTEPRIRLGDLAMELVAPLVKPGEPVTKELMEAALQLKKNTHEVKEHKLIERVSEQIETLTTLLVKQAQQKPSSHADTIDKEVVEQLTQLNKYHSENIKHQEYVLMGIRMISAEVSGLKRMMGFLAASGTSVEKELYDATLKGIDRMNRGVDMFREREGIELPTIEKSSLDKVAHFEKTSRGVDLEEEHKIEEKEYER